MSIYGADGLVLRGQVQRGYTIQAGPQLCYQYLSDVRRLLAQVPYVTKVQVGKTSGRARALFTMTVMGLTINALLDLDPEADPEQLTIRLKNAAEPLAAVPAGYYTCSFQCFIKINPTTQGTSRVSSQIVLAVDTAPLVAQGMVARSLVEFSGPTLLQEYCERLCDDYIINLMQDFRRWQAEQVRRG